MIFFLCSLKNESLGSERCTLTLFRQYLIVLPSLIYDGYDTFSINGAREMCQDWGSFGAGAAYGFARTCVKVYNATSPTKALVAGVKGIVRDCTPLLIDIFIPI